MTRLTIPDLELLWSLSATEWIPYRDQAFTVRYRMPRGRRCVEWRCHAGCVVGPEETFRRWIGGCCFSTAWLFEQKAEPFRLGSRQQGREAALLFVWLSFLLFFFLYFPFFSLFFFFFLFFGGGQHVPGRSRQLYLFIFFPFLLLFFFFVIFLLLQRQQLQRLLG